jgi:methyl-accepting chemotaxis protein
MLILGVFALNQMSKIRGAAEDITNSSVPSIKSLDEFTQLTLRLRVLSYRLLVNREPDVQQKTMELLDTRNQQIRAAQSAYEPLIAARRNARPTINTCSCWASTARSKTG